MSNKAILAIVNFLIGMTMGEKVPHHFFSEIRTSSPMPFEGDFGEALYLTPLIEGGQLDKAKKNSMVQLEGMENIRSYAGYFTVNKTYNSNLFTWFFPAEVWIIAFPCSVNVVVHIF